MMKKIHMKPEDKYVGLKIFAAFCAGLAVGLLVSPAKNGIGCNSGNLTHNHYHWDDEVDECCCGDEDCQCGEDSDKEEDA